MKNKAGKVLYSQCVLKHDNVTLVTWLPQKRISVGSRVSLKEYPEKVWTVEEMGCVETEEVVMLKQREHKNWRKVTDV
jgi:hypothetical protein